MILRINSGVPEKKFKRLWIALITCKANDDIFESGFGTDQNLMLFETYNSIWNSIRLEHIVLEN